MARKFPSRDYATVHIKRGSEGNIKAYGSTWAEATPEQRQAREAIGFYGKGAYFGGMLRTGARLAMPYVKKHGMAMAKDMFRSYTGMGAYNRNQLVDPTGPAEVAGSGDETGSIVISRSELVCEIYGPTSAFKNNEFALNPGIESSFPWLSQIAANYEEYSFRQLLFHFNSTVTDIGSSTTGQIGSIIMATNYNASSTPFRDKPEMMAYMGANSCKASENAVHGVECDPAKLTFSEGYVRVGPPTGNMDLKVYDHGLFQIAVANSPTANANLSVGELWVSYTVELRKPKFGTARGNTIQQDIYCSGAAPTVGAPLGPTLNLLQAQCNSINSRVTQTGNRTVLIEFPPNYAGQVSVEYVATLNTTTTGSVSSTTTGNVFVVSDLLGGSGAISGSFLSPPAIGVNATMQWVTSYRIEPATGGVVNSITLSLGAAWVASFTRSSLYIREVNASFSTRAQNVGPSGAQSDAPIMINNQGVITQPV